MSRTFEIRYRIYTGYKAASAHFFTSTIVVSNLNLYRYVYWFKYRITMDNGTDLTRIRSVHILSTELGLAPN